MKTLHRLATVSLFALGSMQGAASISTDKTSYLVLERITVNYSGLPGNAKDWITIVPATASDLTEGPFQFTGGAASGRMTFEPPADPGTYEARLYFNNSYKVEQRVRFTIAFPVPSVTTDKASYLVLENITATYANMPGYPKDYLTIVPKGTPDSQYGAYVFTNGVKSGKVVFDPVEPGEWEVRALFRNENGPVRARAALTVSYPIPVLTLDKSQYSTTDRITVSYTGMPGYAKDYITLVNASAPDGVYGAYQFTTGKTGALRFDALPAGRYEARAIFRNEDAKIRARVPFTVGEAACTISISPTSGSVVSGGGSATIRVTASTNDCAWSATASGTWLTVAPASGKGSANVNYTATANTGAASRTGTISFGSQSFTLTQAGQSTDSGVNLLRNPGAEEGPATYDYYGQLNLPGWRPDGIATVYPYAMGDTLTSTDPGPADRGLNLFGGGFGPASSISQTVNVSASSSAIDAGGQKFTLSAWLGGWSTQNDNALLRVSFRNASGAALGTAQVGPVLAADRGSITSLVLRSTSGTVPAGTRTVDVVLAFERRDGTANDGYADNLVFRLDSSGGTGGCTYALSPQSTSVAAAGGTGSVSVTAATGCTWSAAFSATWASITAGSSGSGNGTIQYSAQANSGAARSAVLQVQDQRFTLNQAAAAPANAPSFDSKSVVNLTDGSSAIAPGSLVMIGGSRLSTTTMEAPAGQLPSTLGGVSVDVESGGKSYPAAILSVSPSPLTLQIPYEAATSPIRIRVRTSEGSSAWVEVPLVARAPRVVVLPGGPPNWAKAFHFGGEPVSKAEPAIPGEQVQVHVTGLGVTTPAAMTGAGATEGAKLAVGGVSVKYGTEEANVVSAVLGPAAGVYVVTFVTPFTAPAGDAPLTVTVDEASSQADVLMTAGEKESQLTRNWNGEACSLTDKARFQIGVDARLTRVTGWYRWEDNEQSVPFRLTGGGELASGELARGSCDPFQPNWCEATARVSVELTPGQEYELRPERAQLCGNTRSNDNGFIATWGVVHWETGTPATVGPDGGTIDANGFHLSIPAGNLAQPTLVRVSWLLGRTYRVEGFSATGTRGATLDLEISPEMAAGGKLLAQIAAEEETDRGPMYLPVEVVDGKARIVFPDPGPAEETTIARAAGAGRAAVVDPTRIASLIRLLANISEEKTADGHFILHYPAADFNDPYISDKQAENMLGTAYAKLGEVIDTGRRKAPIDVYVFSFKGTEGQVQFADPDNAGASETNIWGKANLGLTLNRDLVADPSQTEQVRITAGHELFHVFQSLWDPRPWPTTVLHSNWLWFQEASATWFEKKMSSRASSFTPDNTKNYRTYMLERGLEYMPGQTTIKGTSYARHGYGAASFLEHLHPVGYGEKSVGELVRMMGERTGTLSKTWLYTPVEAINKQVVPILPLKWRDYLVALLEGKVYPGIDLGQIATPAYQASGKPAINTYTFKADDDRGPGTDEWKSPDLSAKLYIFEFKNRNTAWKDNTLKLVLDDPGGDAEMLVFKPNGSKGELLGRSQKEFLVKNLETFAKAGSTLYVLVANGHAKYPFTGSTDIRFSAGPDLEIMKTRWVSAGIQGKMVDASGNDIQSMSYTDGNPTQPDCILSWSGLTFSQSCKTKSTTTTTITEVFEGTWTASGTIAADGKSLKNVSCKMTGKTTATAIGPDGKPSVSTKEYGVELALVDVPVVAKSEDPNEIAFRRTVNAASSVSGTARQWVEESYGGSVTKQEFRPVRVDSVLVNFRIPPAGLFPK